MTLQLDLHPELAMRLRHEAERRGQSTESVAVQLLAEHLPPPQDARQAAAVAMLRRWAEEDAQLPPEAAAANAKVLRALDEDRPSHRKLFSEVLKDTPR